MKIKKETPIASGCKETGENDGPEVAPPASKSERRGREKDLHGEWGETLQPQ